jgi:hypothetical protein
MTGIKGRSGKATTLAAKQAKSAGGAKGGRGRSSAPSLPPSTATDPLSDDPVQRLGKPLTWGDELKRAQVDGERTQNRRREVEVQRAEVELRRAREEADEASGRRVLRTDMDAAVKKVRDAWWREAQQIAGLCLPRLTDLPGDIRARIKAAIDAEVSAAADRVKASMA